MKIGVVFPQTEFPADAGAVRAYTQTIEDLGYQHVLTYDHVLGANPDRPGGWQGPYTYEDPFFEPLLLFSHMAAVSDELEFVTGILILPQRETALVAKQTATLDVLCEGRLRLGIGIGWNEVEYVGLNQDFGTRGARSEEQIELLRELWTKPLVTYNGRWHNIPDAGINPRPVNNTIPLWFGGHADVVLERTARLGDGWMPGYRTAAAARPALDKLAGYVEKYGRSVNDLGLEPRLHYASQTLDELLETMTEWQQAGASHISLNTMGAGFSSVDEHLRALRAFAQAAFTA